MSKIKLNYNINSDIENDFSFKTYYFANKHIIAIKDEFDVYGVELEFSREQIFELIDKLSLSLREEEQLNNLSNLDRLKNLDKLNSLNKWNGLGDYNSFREWNTKEEHEAWKYLQDEEGE